MSGMEEIKKKKNGIQSVFFFFLGGQVGRKQAMDRKPMT